MRKFIYYIVLLTLQFITINIYAISTPLIDVDTCSVTIFQNDTTYYSTPTPFYIQLNASQGAYSYNWIPATGLSDPTIYNPMAQINGSIEYVLEAKYLGDNLVYNGDFELGNIGFTTGLLLPSQSSSPYGTYIVASNATSLYPGLCSCTHNGGLFMVADGSPNPTTTFQTQVNVEPNTDYKFSVELTNVNQSPDFTDGWRPIFQFSVNGAILGSPIIVSSDCCSWNRFYQVWNSSNNTHATISIINLNTSSAGNDFCIDNVSLRKICKAYDTINIQLIDPSITPIDISIKVCENEFPYHYYDSVYYEAGNYRYIFSTDGEVDSTYAISLGVYNQYEILIYDTICDGETYNENGFDISVAGRYSNTLTTIHGCDSIINLVLYVKSIQDTIVNAVICQGEVYNQYGITQGNAGTYFSNYSFGESCQRRVVLNLEVISSPEMLLFPEDDMMVEDYPIILDASCVGCNSYLWNTGSITSAIDVYHKGLYIVYAFSECGNISDSIYINNPDVYLFMPNSFTPSESSNFVFEINAEKNKIDLVVFEVFNRWGEKVFESKDIDKGWDGNYKGRICNSDNYTWRILYKTKYSGSLVFEKVGEVSLIR